MKTTAVNIPTRASDAGALNTRTAIAVGTSAIAQSVEAPSVGRSTLDAVRVKS